MVVHDVNWVQKNYADAAGAVVLDVKAGSYAPGGRKERTIVYQCAKCGEVAEMGLNHLVYRHQNEEFHCKKCRKRKKPGTNRVFTYDYIKSFFDDAGVEMLTTPDEVKGVYTKVKYKCRNCGEPTQATCMNIFYRSKGMEFQFLCSNCKSNSSPTLEEINERFFKPAGAKLFTTEYVNAASPLEFECTNCGKKWQTNYHRLTTFGSNLQFLCGDCMGVHSQEVLKSLHAGSWKDVNNRRTTYDRVFGRYINFFFNLSQEESSKYIYHHIYPFFGHHELATSITNIYPIDKEIHKFNKKESLYRDLHIPFGKPVLTIENYPEDFKLSFHSESFKFFDPMKYIVTEIVIPEFVTEKAEENLDFNNRVDATIRSGLIERKLEYKEKGVLYLPFFYTEYLSKRAIIRSMLMIRGEKLFSGFSDLYGFKVRHLYARKCVVKKIPSEQAFRFFEETHIQGGVKAKHNYGLFYGDELVGCMSFGIPRVKASISAQFELYRLAYSLLTVVAGGASKLFKFAVKDLAAQSIVSYCDLRFTDIDSDSVYQKLGFVFDSKTKPNYRYYDAKTHSLNGRMSYQKHLLAEKLEKFDPNISEMANCIENGLVPQFDCGNAKYIWKAQEKVSDICPGQTLDMFAE